MDEDAVLEILLWFGANPVDLGFVNETLFNIIISPIYIHLII